MCPPAPRPGAVPTPTSLCLSVATPPESMTPRALQALQAERAAALAAALTAAQWLGQRSQHEAIAVAVTARWAGRCGHAQAPVSAEPKSPEPKPPDFREPCGVGGGRGGWTAKPGPEQPAVEPAVEPAVGAPRSPRARPRGLGVPRRLQLDGPGLLAVPHQAVLVGRRGLRPKGRQATKTFVQLKFKF